MKKLILGVAASVAMLFAVQANAQQTYGNAGLEFAIPLGDFSDSGANFGIGGSGLYEVGITDNFAVLGNVGVLFYATESKHSNITQIPIQVGARYYLDEQRVGAFAGVKTGIHLNIFGTDIEGADSQTKTYFGVAPEVGYFVNENISVSLKYQLQFVPSETVETSYTDPFTGVTTTNTYESDGTTFSYLGVRLAYSF